jgi:FkbM family methyltransferase
MNIGFKCFDFLFKTCSFVACVFIFGILEFILSLSSLSLTFQILTAIVLSIFFILSVHAIFVSSYCQCVYAKITYWFYFLSFIVLACTVSWACIRNGASEVLRNAKLVGASSRSMLVEKDYAPGFASRLDVVNTSLKLAAKNLFHNQAEIISAQILDFDVQAYSYNYLLCLYNEVFVFRDYFVENVNAQKPFIVDCGGNIGMSILFFKKMYPEAKIISFEPNAKNLNILKNNIKNNNLHNVQIIDKAVSDQSGQAYFYDYGNVSGSLNKNATIDNAKKIEVDTVLLSDYITEPVDILKIDIEGAESTVLLELASKDKLKLVKNIAMEYHYSLDDSNKLPEVLQALEKNGFKWWLGPTAKDVIGKGSRLTMIYAKQR